MSLKESVPLGKLSRDNCPCIPVCDIPVHGDQTRVWPPQWGQGTVAVWTVWEEDGSNLFLPETGASMSKTESETYKMFRY